MTVSRHGVRLPLLRYHQRSGEIVTTAASTSASTCGRSAHITSCPISSRGLRVTAPQTDAAVGHDSSEARCARVGPTVPSQRNNGTPGARARGVRPSLPIADGAMRAAEGAVSRASGVASNLGEYLPPPPASLAEMASNTTAHLPGSAAASVEAAGFSVYAAAGPAARGMGLGFLHASSSAD